MIKKLTAVLLGTMMLLSCAACGKTAKKDDYKPVSGLDTNQKATIRIAIPYETNKALNTVSNAFMEKYPNVTIQLMYVEDYDKNAVQLVKENELDLILQKDVSYTEYTVTDSETREKVPDGTSTEDYFYNFLADTEIDFSDTIPEISNNYRHTRTDKDGKEVTYSYCYPLGGETRGVFVNKTLLEHYGLSVPENYQEFLACCKTLKNHGLIAVQGGGDTASYGLGLAPAANAIVHNETALNQMKNAQAGVSSEFKDTLEKIYTIATNRYFDYKAVEEGGFFLTTNELGQAESFLGLRKNMDTFEMEKPDNNYGNAAFLPYISSAQTVIEALIDEYKLDTQIAFICSPLNEEGNSPVYITPYYGICANKNSSSLIWVREFVNFLFQKENNTIYAENASIIPNTEDAFAYVADQYGVDVDKDVTVCGQIRFSDQYNGYTPIANTLKEVLKCSAQKYMVNLNKDASGNIQYETDENGKRFLYMGNGTTKVYENYVGKEDSVKKGYAFCTLDYYLDYMEEQFRKYRS